VKLKRLLHAYKAGDRTRDVVEDLVREARRRNLGPKMPHPERLLDFNNWECPQGDTLSGWRAQAYNSYTRRVTDYQRQMRLFPCFIEPRGEFAIGAVIFRMASRADNVFTDYLYGGRSDYLYHYGGPIVVKKNTSLPEWNDHNFQVYVSQPMRLRRQRALIRHTELHYRSLITKIAQAWSASNPALLIEMLEKDLRAKGRFS
jgi:hypothetical protein